MPQYAVSIALAKVTLLNRPCFRSQPQRTVHRQQGRGAFLNERRIRVSRRTKLGEALIGTGFPYRMFDKIDLYLAIFKELAEKTAGQRRPAPPRWIWPTSPAAATTVSGNSACRRGTWQPVRCSSPKPAA
jgi:hypothetical protein